MYPEAKLDDKVLFGEDGKYALIQVCAVNDRNSLWEYIIRVTELVTPNSGFKVGDIHTISKTKNKNWANYVNWHFWKLDDPHAQMILKQDKLDS